MNIKRFVLYCIGAVILYAGSASAERLPICSIRRGQQRRIAARWNLA